MQLLPTAVIECTTKIFAGTHRPALNSISCKIFAGLTGVVGPDGAGKTTMMRLLIGLLAPDKGRVLIQGLNTQTETDAIHRICGYMPQKFGLYEDLSVIENLELHADLRGINEQEQRLKFQQLLEFSCLEPFKDRLAGQLSGGMKQKLGLACALIGSPKILFLDEPGVGVDPISREELWQMVKGLVSSGVAVVWATSYLDEAAKCDHIILLNEGCKIYDGTPAKLIKRVEGRTWQTLVTDAYERRKVLIQNLKNTEVLDGIILGSNVHILSKTKAWPVGKWKQSDPSFESAFIDVLGGILSRSSSLASTMIPKPFYDVPAIEATALTKQFGNFTAVKDVSFQIKRGEIFGLLGPNGAGKSTVFKMICGLLQPTHGQTLIMGLNLHASRSQARSRIGYMAQKFSLYGNLSILQNLRFFGGLYGLSSDHLVQEIKLLVEIFRFNEYLNMKAEDLPLGIKQRLSLCCAIMHRPDVLFLDEPTSGVDLITRREFWMHINAFVAKGMTVMVTTHFMEEAEFCDRIALIYNSQNIASGTPEDLKALSGLKNPTLEDAFVALIERKKVET